MMPNILQLFHAAYNAFMQYGHSFPWCKGHALSFRAMSRAVSIWPQLKQQCLVSRYWRNRARWIADGTYQSVRGGKVFQALNIHPNSMFIRKCKLLGHFP
ncbi:hypothetical protein JB92DRAFT_2943853 [Gautieria morchelliformis]|nr:hypothetical protein JB92DRAFT_2943853 [Gautieria morchelliformis]